MPRLTPTRTLIALALLGLAATTAVLLGSGPTEGGIQRRLPIVSGAHVKPAGAGGEARVRRALPGQKQANIIF